MGLKVEVLFVAILMLAGWPASVSGDRGPGPRTPDNNNNFANATNITSGVPVNDSVDITDDAVDYYRIVDENKTLLTVKAGQIVKMVLNFTNSSASLNLSLYNNTGYCFVKLSSGGQSRGTTFLNTANRYIYLEVRADNCTSDYTLTVTVTYPLNLSSGCPVSGHLTMNGADRIDYYQINATVGQTIKMVLDFTDLSANLSLRLMSPTGTVYTTISSGGQSRGTTFLYSSNVTYYLEVKVNNNTSDYTLTATVAFPPLLSPGVRVSGYLTINGADRVDYYQIPVLAEQTIKMVLNFTNLSANLGLRLTNAYVQNFEYVASGQESRGITFLTPINMTYYIEVKVSNNTSDYTLIATVAYPQILSPGAQVSGSLSMDGADRADFYRIWLDGNVGGSSEAAVLNLTQSGQDVNLRAEIFDNMVMSYDWQKYNETWNLSKRANLSASAAHTGWYFCKVYITSGTSGYTMSYSKTLAPSDGDNDYASAIPVPRNGVMYGNASKARDHYDWFSYSALTDDPVFIEVTRANSTDSFTVVIYNSTMAFLWSLTDTSSSNNSLDFWLPSYMWNETYYVGIGMRTAYRANPLWGWTEDESYMDYTATFFSNNKAPTLYSPIDPQTMNEDDKLRLNMSAHFRDIDGNPIDYIVEGAPHIKGTYSNASDELELSPAPNWFGKEMVALTATDGELSSQALFYVTVNPVEDPPAARKIPDITMAQNGTDRSLDLGKYLYDNDTIYGDSLTYGVSGNRSIRVSITPEGNLTLAAPIDFWGVVNMTFTATDNASLTASGECMVTVSHVNQAPQVKTTPPEISMDEDEGVALDLAPVFWDPDGDPITVVPSGNAQVNVTQQSGTLNVTFRAGPDASGFFENIKLTARDDKGLGGNYATVKVTVVPVNDPPRITSFSPAGDVVMKEDQTQEFSISAFDVENGAVVNYAWSFDDQPVMLGMTSYSYKANFSSAGCHTVAVSVDDGELFTTKTWNLTVLNVNHEPYNVAILSPKPGAVVREGIPVLLDAQAQDPDGDSLEYTWMEGSRELGKGRTLSIIFPVGSHSITLDVTDGEAVVKTKVVKFAVNVNSAPRMESLSPTSGQRFNKGDKIHFVASFSDPENDALSYCWTEGGKVLSNSSSFYKSDLPAGRHIILLSVSDGLASTDTTLTIEVSENGKGFIPGMGAGLLALAAAITAIFVRKRKPPGAMAASFPAGLANTGRASGAGRPPAPYRSAIHV